MKINTFSDTLNVDEKIVLDEKEASLALKISVADLRRLVRSGALPHSFVVGQSVRVRRSSLLDLLAEKKK